MAGFVISRWVRAKDDGPIQITAVPSGNFSASTSLMLSGIIRLGAEDVLQQPVPQEG